MQSSLVGEVQQYLNELGYDDSTTLLAMTRVILSDGTIVLFENLSNECMVRLFKETFKIKYTASDKQENMIIINAVNSDNTVELIYAYEPLVDDVKPESGSLIEIYKKSDVGFMEINMQKEYATMHRK